MTFNSIKYEQRGAVAWITLHRPDAMNALSPELIEELDQALTSAEGDPAIRALATTLVIRPP